MGNPVYWALGTAIAAAVAGALAWAVATRRLGRYGPFVAVFAVFAVLWTAWPYWYVYQLQTALADGDKVRLSVIVDWPSVRDGIREDLKAAYANKFVSPDPRVQGLAQALGGAAIDRMVEAQINPSTLSQMVRQGYQDDNPMSVVRYAFFERGPFVFRTDIGPPGSSPDHQSIYIMEWNWGWRLERIMVAPYLLGLGDGAS